MNGFKKGDRVMWRNKDEQGVVSLKHGTVTRGGKRIVATMDGGKYEVKGIPAQFRHSDKPLPKDAPSPMDDYSVEKYDEFPQLSDETACFAAKIAYKGKVVLQAQNQGCGGDTELRPVVMMGEPLTATNTVDLFVDAAKAWAVQFGQTRPFEAYDEWIDWYVNHRPYGVTAAKFNQDIEKHMAEIRG